LIYNDYIIKLCVGLQDLGQTQKSSLRYYCHQPLAFMDSAYLVTLMLLPFYFLFIQALRTLEALTHFKGQLSGSNEFDPYYFGIANTRF